MAFDPIPDCESRAYEIKYHWGEEPPPPEILENLTAKGGDVRKRTLDNFNVPGSRETGLLVDGVESAEDEQRTPRTKSTIEAEEGGSGVRYPTSKKNPGHHMRAHAFFYRIVCFFTEGDFPVPITKLALKCLQHYSCFFIC